MKKTISSKFTIYLKIIFPTMWALVFGTIVASWILKSGFEADSLIVLVTWLLGTFFLIWYFFGFKTVQMDENKVYISDFFRTIEVDKSNIADITENVYLNHHPVFIHFKNPTEFGQKIVFIPTTRFFAYFTPHPIVGELKKFANISNKGPGNI